MGIFEKNAVVKNQGTKTAWRKFLEIVVNGKRTGSVWKETIAVSATIWISVEKLHHQIRLRILSTAEWARTHAGPEVPEVKVRVVECRDGLARIASEELAKTHSVKNGTLQNACTIRPRVVVGLGRSAHSHIVRLMNSQRKGLKRMMTEVLWLCWKREIGKKENLSPMDVTIERGHLGKEVIRNWDEIHLNVNYLMHGNWVAYFKTWRRRSLFSGRALTCRSRSNVWSSQRQFETKILRSDTFVQMNLMSVAQRSKIWGSFTRRDRVARARCPRSSVEAGQKCVKIKGAWKSNILLTFGK